MRESERERKRAAAAWLEEDFIEESRKFITLSGGRARSILEYYAVCARLLYYGLMQAKSAIT
jgi:hypothetical protein